MSHPKPSRSKRMKAKFDAETAKVLKQGEMRHDCLVRAKFLCEACGCTLATAGFEWHHVVYGSGKREQNEAVDTTACLCPTCHRRAHDSHPETLGALLDWAARHGYREAHEEVTRRMAKFKRLGVVK